MQFNINQIDLVGLVQGFKPLILVKGVILLLLLGYALFQLIIFRQIKAMEKIITQPVSSAIVSFISLAFVAGSVILMIIVLGIPI